MKFDSFLFAPTTPNSSQKTKNKYPKSPWKFGILGEISKGQIFPILP